MIGCIFHVYYYNTFNQMCLIYLVRSDVVDADGDQGTLPLPKFKHKDSWMANTNKVQGGW